MKRLPWYALVLLATLAVIALGGCGAPPSPTSVPSATPVPSTAIPGATLRLPTPAEIVATSTAVATTAAAVSSPTVPVSPTLAGSISQTIQAALDKNQALKTYRGELNFTSAQNIIVKWQGTVRVPDSHSTYTDGQVKDAEVIRVGSNVYLRQADTSGASSVWSLLPESMLSRYTAYSPRGSLQQVVGDLNSFHKTDSVTLDGIACDLYEQDKRAVASTFIGILQGQTIPPSDEAAALFDQAQLQLWICADGYLHQAEMSLVLKPQAGSPSPTSIELFAHISDLNSDIQIDAPTNLVAYGAPAPTPTPTGIPFPTALTPAASASSSVSVTRPISGFQSTRSPFPTGAYTETQATGTRSIVKGNYIWETTTSGDSVDQFSVPSMAPAADFNVSVVGQVTDGGERNSYGLVLRGKDTDNQYTFQITNFGDYEFTTTSGGKYNVNIYPTASPVIKKGQPNKLTVVAQGSHFRLLINDRQVNEVDDTLFPSGSVGLVINAYDTGAHSKFQFSHFLLSPVPPAKPTATPPVPSANGNLVLQDSFDNNKHNWQVDSNKSIANGKYVWKIADGVNIFDGLPTMPDVRDFAASVDVHFTAGSPNCGFGLTFRNTQAGSYVFYIQDNQLWGFDIIHSPDPGIAQNGGSAAIHLDAVNRVSVLARGNQLTFSVNGQVVGHVQDATLSQGRVGAAVWRLGDGGDCNVEFDNFEVRVFPNALPTSTPAPTPTP